MAISLVKFHETKPNLPKKILARGRSEAEVRDQLETVGLESDGVINSAIAGKKRGRSQSAEAAVEKRGRSKSRDPHHRAQSATRGPTAGSVAPRQKKQVEKSKKVLERHLFKYAKAGEADREHYPKLVKHLNSGKRSLGTSTIGR